MSQNKIMKNSAIVIVIIIIGKIFAFTRDILVTSKFGATYSTDIYMFAIGIIFLLTTISYGLTTTFIPIHTKLLENEEISKDKKNEYVNNVINASALFTIILMVLGIIFAKYIVMGFAPGFQNNAMIYSNAIKIVRIMFLSLVFLSVQSVITGVLQAHKQFYEPAAMSAASCIVTILYLIFLSDRFGIYGFAFATVIGFIVQLIINIPKYKKLGYIYKFYIDFKDPGLSKLIRLMIPVIVSTSVVQLNLLVNRYFASTLYEGAVTALDLSNKLNIMMYEVFAIAISMVIYPTLSSLVANNNKEDYNNALIKAVNVILLITVPAAVAMGVLSYPIVSIIFRRGAFNNNSAQLTAMALTFYCPAMVAYGVRDVLNKAFYSINDSKTPMINSLIGILINILLDILLIRNMAVSGLTMATSIAISITTIFLLISLKRKLKGIVLTKLYKSAGKICASSFLMGIALLLINKLCIFKMGNTNKGNLISLILCFVVGMLVYFQSIRIFKLEEYEYFIDIIHKKFKK